MRFSRLKQALANHRKLLVVSIVAVLLVGAGTFYVLWSIGSWNQYETAHTTRVQELGSKLDAVLRQPSGTTETRTHKRTALKEVTQDFSQANDLCTPHALLQWQAKLSFAKSKVEQCRERIGHLASITEDLRSLVDLLEDDAALAAILRSVEVPKQLKADQATAQQQQWQEITSKIEALSVSEAFEPVKKEAVARAEEVRSSWKSIEEANKAQDKTRYTKALQSMDSAYVGLVDVHGPSMDAVDAIIEPLQASYRAAFK